MDGPRSQGISANENNEKHNFPAKNHQTGANNNKDGGQTRELSEPMISLFSSISRMSSSPYFTSSGRQTRSAAREAISALSTRQKQPRRHIKVEYEKRRQEEDANDDNKIENVAAKKPKKEVSLAQAQTSGWEPANWREQLANIREMRKSRDAPVDSQGCEKTADVNQSPEVMMLG